MMHLALKSKLDEPFSPRPRVWFGSHIWVVALVTLAALALGIRVWGLAFGLPYRYHIDETFYVAGALRMASNRFNLPIITHGPNLFYMLLLAEDVAYFVVMRLMGVVGSVAAFEQLYRNDPTVFVLLARLTSAIAGVLTLVPTYLIGKRLHGRTVGFAAAVLLAFNFQHVRESHYGTPDVFVGLLVTSCLLMCITVMQTGRMRSYVLCGILAGLATGTKFTSVLVCLPIGIAHGVVAWRESDGKLRNAGRRMLSGRLFAVVLSFGLAFAIAYPNVVLRPAAFLEYVRFLIDVGKTGFITQFRIDSAPAWLYYLHSLSWGMGWILLSFLGLGLIVITLRRQTGDLLVLSFIAIYLAFLSRSPYYASRYLVPFLPGLCVFAAAGIHWLAGWRRRQWNTSVAVIYGLIISLAILQPLASAIRHDYLLTQKDTRTIAKDWIETNIPAGTKVAVDWQKHAPPLRTMADAFPPGDVPYDVMEAGGIGLPCYSLDEYKDANVSYLVMSSFIDDLMLSSPADSEAKRLFHKALDDSCELVYEVKPYSGRNKPPFVFDQIFGPVTSLWRFERPGPTIKVYKVR
ncbi:MAG: glycosyltransferase family 39 protein [Anaerolineales bacterium]|nr:glycosyltransferase family 39 protein [Anaerolineales bacterium]